MMKLSLSTVSLLVLLFLKQDGGECASFFSWGGGGGAPTTPEPTPCGLAEVPIDAQLNTTVDASLKQVVWQVSVMTKGMGATWKHTCGGALIGKQAVLTSASCVDGMNAGFVRIEGGIVALPKGGFVRRKRFTYPGALTPGLAYTEKVVTHPQYNKATGENDLAVLKLATPMDFAKANGTINTICLPDLPLAASDGSPPALFLSGWGALGGAGKLRGVLQLKNTEVVDCTGYVNDGEFCAAQEEGGECEGDLGGALFTESNAAGAQVIGVVSRGTACSKESPMIVTEVFPYLEWIADASKPNY